MPQDTTFKPRIDLHGSASEYMGEEKVDTWCVVFVHFIAKRGIENSQESLSFGRSQMTSFRVIQTTAGAPAVGHSAAGLWGLQA